MRVSDTRVEHLTAALPEAPGPAVITRRLLAGFVAMPFVAALTSFPIWVVIAQARSQGTRLYGTTHNEQAAVMAVFTFITAVIIIVVAAGPLFFWWQRQREPSFNWTTFWGAVLGNIPLVVTSILMVIGRLRAGGPPSGDYRWALLLFSMGTTVGLACGCAFWLIALSPRKAQPAQV